MVRDICLLLIFLNHQVGQNLHHIPWPQKIRLLQSDISKMQMEPDKSFKRADTSFRNTIAKGSQFEPEIGGFQCFMRLF